jgi:hypothetical protein
MGGTISCGAQGEAAAVVLERESILPGGGRGVSIALLHHLQRTHPEVNDMITADVIAHIIRPATAAARVSYAELLRDEVDASSGAPLVSDRPHCMISHAWACPFSTFVGAIEAHVAEQPGGGARYYLLIDMFALNQHALADACARQAVFPLLRAVLSDMVQAPIHDTLVLVLDSFSKPTLLTRCWCLFEVAVAERCGVKVVGTLENGQLQQLYAELGHDREHVLEQLQRLDVEKASATDPYDKECILAEICSLPDIGGFAGFNELIRGVIDSWCSTLQVVSTRRRPARHNSTSAILLARQASTGIMAGTMQAAAASAGADGATDAAGAAAVDDAAATAATAANAAAAAVDDEFKCASAASSLLDTRAAAAEAFHVVQRELGRGGKAAAPREPDALIVFCSAGHDAAALGAALRELAPAQCAVHGCTSCRGAMGSGGLALGGGGVERRALQLFAISDPSGLWITAGVMGCDAASVSAALVAAMAGGVEAPALVLLASAPNSEEQALRGIEDALGNVPVFGGTAADDAFTGEWWQLCGDSVSTAGASMLLCWPTVSTFIRLGSLFHEVAPARRGVVTALVGGAPRHIGAIDGKPAAEVYSRWTNGAFDAELSAGSGDTVVVAKSANFPLGKQVDGSSYTSLVHPMSICGAGATLRVSANVEVGAQLRILSAPTQQLVNSVPASMADCVAHAGFAEGLIGGLVVYCGGMRMCVGDERIGEVAASVGAAFGEKPWAGHFSFGEQGPALAAGSKRGRVAARALWKRAVLHAAGCRAPLKQITSLKISKDAGGGAAKNVQGNLMFNVLLFGNDGVR